MERSAFFLAVGGIVASFLVVCGLTYGQVADPEQDVSVPICLRSPRDPRMHPMC